MSEVLTRFESHGTSVTHLAGDVLNEVFTTTGGELLKGIDERELPKSLRFQRLKF